MKREGSRWVLVGLPFWLAKLGQGPGVGAVAGRRDGLGPGDRVRPKRKHGCEMGLILRGKEAGRAELKEKGRRDVDRELAQDRF